MSAPDHPCPRCAAPLPADARFCAACGFAVSRLQPGQVLDGKYQILDKIGEGGMGEVYRARHLHLDEIRIIKVTKPDTAGDGAQARRFQEEARLATLVRHPNVAALYDFSRQPDDSYYMVWEFIDGVTLEAWLQRSGKLPPVQVLEVARQVLAGLAEIHAQGIVHRDLSPDNIMLRELPGGRLQAKIIDLGIAKRVAAESLQMTGTGLFLGKLKYCSPEQAGALPVEQALDGRTDIYSFGVVLYEMLAGRAPFESTTPEGFIGKHLNTPPPPLDVSDLPRSVGLPLAAAVAKTLEKRRERRYASASDLADALARITPEAQRSHSAAVTLTTASSRSAPRAGTIALASIAALAVAVGAVVVERRSGTVRGRTATVSRTAMAPHQPPPSPPAQVRFDETAASPAAQSLREAVGSAGALMPTAPFSAAVAPAPPSSAEAAAPRPGATTAPEAQRLITLWKARPNEARARRALEVARVANEVAGAYPADPRTAEIKATLPAYLKAQATAALDTAEPIIALLYFRAYRALDFAAPDADLERRLETLRPSDATPVARRRVP
jgi:serine/threonine protein kinase